MKITQQIKPMGILRFFAPSLILAALLVIVLLPGLLPAKQTSTATKPIVTKAVPSTASKPATVPTAPPDPAKSPPKTVPAPKTTAAHQPAPVVVPSPASSVSSLTPEPATLPPSSSSDSSDGSNASPASTVSYSSTNWAGYLVASASYTRVSGSWVVPTVTGNGTSTSADAAWVGIGGVSTSDLIQVGTTNIVSAAGQVTTSAFYELLPSFAQNIASLVISPGDSISASVSEISSGQWMITITDNTTSQSYTHTVAYASTHSSAEWIEEDPSYSRGSLIPLDNFSPVTFSNASATTGGVAGSLVVNGAQMISLVNNVGSSLATTSAIRADGASFSVSHN